MISEILSVYSDPLAGGYLWGWALVIASLFIQSGALLLLGVVLMSAALLLGGLFAYAE